MRRTFEQRLGVVVLTARFWPFAVSPGSVVQVRPKRRTLSSLPIRNLRFLTVFANNDL